MRLLLSKILITSTVLILSACGNGDHMPLSSSNSGLQGKPGQSSGSSNEVTFADVKPIFKRTCANCHVPGGTLPDWQDYSVAFAKRDRLYDRVIVKKDMPLGGGLSDDERKLIGKWLSGGALKGPVTRQQAPTVSAPAQSSQPVNGPILTYNKDIRPIFEKNCTFCHSMDSGLPNWMDYKVAFEKRNRLMGRVVVKKDMPMCSQVSDEDRELIRSWLESGALQE